MTQSVQTKDFLCFAKCTKCTDKGCTPAIENPDSDAHGWNSVKYLKHYWLNTVQQENFIPISISEVTRVLIKTFWTIQDWISSNSDLRMAYEIYLHTTFNSKQKFSKEQMHTIMKISVR